jgi:hypothetical protein
MPGLAVPVHLATLVGHTLAWYRSPEILVEFGPATLIQNCEPRSPCSGSSPILFSGDPMAMGTSNSPTASRVTVKVSRPIRERKKLSTVVVPVTCSW